MKPGLLLLFVILYLLSRRRNRLTLNNTQVVVRPSEVLITAPFEGFVIPSLESLEPYADAAGFTQYEAHPRFSTIRTGKMKVVTLGI
jgi:hypothetical protein